MTRFVEIKRRLDGTELRFDCDPVSYTQRLAICAFRSTGSFTTTHFTMVEGTVSYGFFWAHRPYILYRITQPGGEVTGYRFDVVDRVRIRPDGAEYRDLVVDAWVTPGAGIELEDEDELAELAQAGSVEPTLLARVERAAGLLLREHPRILAEVERDLGVALAQL